MTQIVQNIGYERIKISWIVVAIFPWFSPYNKSDQGDYNLPEISPDDDPITEIYPGDEIIPPEEFRQEIENKIRENPG